MLRPTRIPTLATRPWRLVPELDGFSDDECTAVFHDLRAARAIGLAVAFPITIVLGLSIVLGGELWLEWALGRRSVWLDADCIQGRAMHVLRGVLTLVVTLTAALTPYAVIMRAAIRSRLKEVSCSGCRYPLIGLPVDDGSVMCPECGGITVLAAHGLREEDIAAGVAKRTGREPREPRRPRRWTAAWIAALAILLGVWVLTGAEWMMNPGLMLFLSVSIVAWSAIKAIQEDLAAQSHQ